MVPLEEAIATTFPQRVKAKIKDLFLSPEPISEKEWEKRKVAFRTQWNKLFDSLDKSCEHKWIGKGSIRIASPFTTEISSEIKYKHGIITEYYTIGDFRTEVGDADGYSVIKCVKCGGYAPRECNWIGPS